MQFELIESFLDLFMMQWNLSQWKHFEYEHLALSFQFNCHIIHTFIALLHSQHFENVLKVILRWFWKDNVSKYYHQTVVEMNNNYYIWCSKKMIKFDLTKTWYSAKIVAKDDEKLATLSLSWISFYSTSDINWISCFLMCESLTRCRNVTAELICNILQMITACTAEHNFHHLWRSIFYHH